MQNEMPNPVNHGVLSATGTVAAEAGSSGLKGMFGGAAALPVAAAGIVGGITGLVSLYSGVSTVLVGATAVGSTMTAGAIATGLFAALGTAAVWAGSLGLLAGGVGLTLGLIFPVIPALAGLGAIFGLAKGASQGAGRVSQEQGAANQMSAQISAMQAQAAMAMNMAPENKYNFPPQGSARNEGGVNISNVQYDGRVGGERALQLA